MYKLCCCLLHTFLIYTGLALLLVYVQLLQGRKVQLQLGYWALVLPFFYKAMYTKLYKATPGCFIEISPAYSLLGLDTDRVVSAHLFCQPEPVQTRWSHGMFGLAEKEAFSGLEVSLL